MLALSANMSFAIIELVGGLWTRSTAIQADAVHDFGDSAALGAALVFQLIAAAPPRVGFSYGLKRFSLLSAVMTAIVLMGGSLYVIVEAAGRFKEPVTPHLDGMLGLAVLGVAVNGFAAWRMSRGESQNERALAWHMVEDLMGWIAVLISSFVMRFWEVPWLDPALAVLIGFLVLSGASRSLWSSVRLFLQAVPRGVSESDLVRKISSVPGVNAVRSLHVWSLDGENHVCTAQVDVDGEKKDWNILRAGIAKAIEDLGSFSMTIEPSFAAESSAKEKS